MFYSFIYPGKNPIGIKNLISKRDLECTIMYYLSSFYAQGKNIPMHIYHHADIIWFITLLP